ncbi:MAG: class I SAM-dependent methyltransferase [Anaeromyxobacteraceae bacterium]
MRPFGFFMKRYITLRQRVIKRPPAMRLAVTTPAAPADADEAGARAAAARRGLAFAPRAGRALARVAADAGADALLVLGRARAALWADGAEHAWSGGMGELRLRRLLAGERATRDPFLDAAALRPGDHVLDATLGLGADALGAAGAVGSGGRVVGVERSLALAALVGEGLLRHASEASRRVEVLAGDAAEILARLPDRSFDVVCFDPMFRSPRAEGPAFDLVRRLGDPRPLAAETLARARRVARRWVVVKDGTPGWDLARLDLVPLPCARWAEKLYARVDAV